MFKITTVLHKLKVGYVCVVLICRLLRLKTMDFLEPHEQMQAALEGWVVRLALRIYNCTKIVTYKLNILKMVTTLN